jgi:acyl carrier protein
MEVNKQQVESILKSVISSVIEDLNLDIKITDWHSKLVIYGRDSGFDSIALVNIIVGIEGLVNEQFGTSITLASEKAFSKQMSPFSTFGRLVNFVHSEIIAE